MVQVRQINLVEYLCCYSETFPVSMEFYAHLLGDCEGGGTVLLAKKNEIPCGMTFAGKKDSAFYAYYTYVHRAYLNDGVNEALLESCLQYAEKLGAETIEWNQRFENSSEKSFQAVLNKKNFELKSRTRTFQFTCSDVNVNKWFDFMEKRGRRIIQRFEDKGFILKPIGDVQPDVFEKIQSQIGTHFSGNLDPKKCYGASPEYSSIIFYKNEPAVFCLATVKKQLITLEQLSTRFDLINSGVFLLSLVHTANKMLKNNASSLIFMINSENGAMLRTLKSFLDFDDVLQIENCVYSYRLCQT